MAHIQIRNVPPELHRKLKIRAAAAGMTLSDYLLRELRPIADLPRLEELIEEVRQGPLVDLDVDTAELIRIAREENDAKWSSRTRPPSSTH
jgi:plasmid stability protein